MSSAALDKAINYAKDATAADTDGRYDEAVKSYQNSIQYFLHSIKYDTHSQKGKEALQQKCVDYLDRAEKLKKYLEDKSEAEKNPKPVASTTGSSSSKQVDKEADKLADQLSSAIVTETPDVHWDDVAGLNYAKQSLQECAILPVKFPKLFAGKGRQPWRGILLYGPPGTGKSYLAKAVATEAKSTYFSVSASDLVSKWQGESERLVKTLFEMAREKKPSIIFIDEIDSIAGERSDGESESTRRIKTEFLVQMQGVGKGNDGVLVLGATNTPWSLDSAVRRRFEKRIYIGLPDPNARETMFKLHMGDTPNNLTPADFKWLAQNSHKFSGADCGVCVRDAIMEPVRKIQKASHFKQVPGQHSETGASIMRWAPCSPRAPGAVAMKWTDIEDQEFLQEPIVDLQMMKDALSITRPTVSDDDLSKNKVFTTNFGTEGSNGIGEDF